MVSKILIGIIYDRAGIKIAVNICLFTAFTSKLILFCVSPDAPAFAILYSLLMSIATPIETVMIPIIVLDLFGQRSFHKTLALTTSLFTVGQALNAPILNIPYDILNNYVCSFAASTVATVVIIVALNCAMKSLKKDARKENI